MTKRTATNRNSQRSNVKNPNNPAFLHDRANRSRQLEDAKTQTQPEKQAD